MSQTIDTLAIEIESNAANSVDGVRKLSRALTSLSKSISSVNGAGIGNVASSVNLMGNAFANVGNSSNKATSGTKKYVGVLPTLTNQTNKAASSTKSLAYYFGKFYANMFLVIRGAKMLGNAISDTMGYMESFNFWDVAINSATAKTDEWKELGYADAGAYAQGFKQGLADFNEKMTGFKTNTETGDITVSGTSNLGINLTNLTTFQAEIVSITSSLGLCTSISQDTSKALSMLVADMSSLKNIDLKTVMNNFQSGLIGQSRALYKYGIDITNATLQTYAYKYGVEKAVSEMTQAEKMQLRMLAILDQSKVAWGDLANTIEQPANQFRVLTNGIKNLGVTIGKILMPVVSTALPYLNAMVKTLQSFFTWMANILGIELDVKNTGTGTTDIFDNIEDSADDATDSVNKLKKSLHSFDNLNIINTSSGSNNGAASVGGVDLSTEINSALAEYEKAWEEAYANMTDKSTLLAQNFEKALAPVKKLIEDIKIGDWFAVGGDVSTIASGIFNFFSDAIERVDWEKIGENIGLFLAGIDWNEVIKSGFRLTIDIGDAIADVWFESFTTAPIETSIITAFATMKFTGLDKVLGTVITTAITNAGGLTITIPLVIAGFAIAKLSKDEDIKKNFERVKKDLEYMFSSEAWKAVGNQLSTWWDDDVLGTMDEDFKEWGDDTRENFKNVGEDLKYMFSSGAWAEVSNQLSEWLEEKEEQFSQWKKDTSKIVSDWKRETEEKFSVWKTNAENSFSNFKTNTQTTISEWYDKISSFFGFDKWSFSGIKDGLKTSFDNAIVAIKEVWNKFANWLNKKLTWTIDPVNVAGVELFKGTTIKLGKIPTFAGGGITSADIFAANENGVPELIGTIGRKTAIASGTEVTGIADAVYSTSSEQNALLREQNALLRQILAKDTGISTRDIFDAVRTENRDYINRNGESAFAF